MTVGLSYWEVQKNEGVRNWDFPVSTCCTLLLIVVKRIFQLIKIIATVIVFLYSHNQSVLLCIDILEKITPLRQFQALY